MCQVFCCVSLLLVGAGEAQTFFTEVTNGIGRSSAILASSTSFGDYNNDGWPDLFLASEDMPPLPNISLLLNTSVGRFVDRTPIIQPEISDDVKGGGAIFGDYDNDGDLDLFVPYGSPGLGIFRHENVLLRNDRGIFADVALESGLIHVQPTDNAIWLDYDRDGYLDLYTGSNDFMDCGSPDAIARNILYHNSGDGTFTDATEEAGVDVGFMGECGGSNGGMGAGDYNDDGWPDLYVGVTAKGFPNRLFVNDGHGGLVEVTTGEIADLGESRGVAVGDIDNDGDLDLFQATGRYRENRPIMFLNIGKGVFLDVTEGIGLSQLTEERSVGARLGDIDNDGDLDLIIGWPHRLFLNNGSGMFEDQTSRSGITGVTGLEVMSLGDYDLDGFLDLVGSRAQSFLFHNNGNDNHWLRVDLVGIQSNRSGIGVRLLATSGDLRQMREILGGNGDSQDEMVAHFGLGERIRVDRLEVRWPSGQVDVLTDIPVDQKIRLFEGDDEYHIVHPTTWQHASQDTVLLGTAFDWDATVRPSLFAKDAEIVRVEANLGAFGEPPNVPLMSLGDGTYRLETITLVAEDSTGLRTISIMIEQETRLGLHWTHLSKMIKIAAAEDQVILSDSLSAGWQVDGQYGAEPVYFTDTGPIYSGEMAAVFQVRPESATRDWRINFQVDPPIRLADFTSLRFLFHPGDATLPETGRFHMFFKGKRFDLLGRSLESVEIDMGVKEWQEVVFPLKRYAYSTLKEFRLLGNMEGTFYLDDLRFVTVEPPPSATAVTEAHTASLPSSITLSQNSPNPFNSDTTIRFALPTPADVELSIFNLAGQQVATLVEGMREAGTYTIHWDGRDDDGRELASGVYLYQLRTGDGQQVATRKLLLIR